MKAVIQRVTQVSVEISGEIFSQIEKGLLVLLGVAYDDNKEKVSWLVEKIINLRIFSDKDGKMNLSLKDIKGSILVVSQFTLYADTRKGNRPSFIQASPPKLAEFLYNHFVDELKRQGIPVATGRFGAGMQVSLVNDGPVTIILEK